LSGQVLLWAVDRNQVRPEHLTRIEALAGGREVVLAGDADSIARRRNDIEVLAGWLPPETVLALPALRWYQQWIAGAEWLMTCPQAVERDFVLTTASGVSAGVVADQVFGYILSATRRLRQAWAQQRERVWRKPALDAFGELAGKTLLVAGVGAIGSRVGQRARGFELQVIGLRRHPDRPAVGFDRIVGPGELALTLAQADLVVSALPLTRETHHLFDAGAFARLKPGALFVSVGRGRVVDEAALVAALVAGRVGAAALDVYEVEPVPVDSPLWALDSVAMTPHWGAMFPLRFERTLDLFCLNLARYVAGEPLVNVVDKALGY
jgi:phosphoglycerate dehydrogenase-like enzyme